MKIIICGAGQVGGQIARHLAREEGGNNITVVDNDPGLVRRLMDGYDVGGIVGFASHPNVLEQAGARDADMVIAATQSDEVNMVVCQVAHSIFAVPRKIARLRSQAYLDAIYTDLYRTGHLPIDVVISPEVAVADAVLQRLSAPMAFDIEGFLEERAQLVGMALEGDCAALYTPIRQLAELFSTLRAVIVGVRRRGKLTVADGDLQLAPGDQIYAIIVTEDLPRFMEAFGKERMKIERAVIIGGGNIGLRVAQSLEKSERRARVTVIERQRERAEIAAEALRRAVVLGGDGMDMHILREANVAETDAMIALTEDDKTNLLACVRAKAAGAKMVVALLNDPSLVDLVEPIGIDAYVNPRSTTVSSILRYVRHGRIRQVYSIADGEAEVIEAQVLRTSALAGKLVREAEMPEAARIGVIRRGDKVFAPRGDTRLAEGDELTIFALSGSVAEVERLFQVGFDFF
ncbi:MAG: Trk system potassium transporter TrkA [Rhodovulum sulfidophilum]|uniref:Trk system potassium uptake protein TrkA n=1 Tax=Rhodovulum sulfidophilum TaxID=35806 RepID=A0A2W5N598_RHOSU|nr:MAG: Trk system potassium transporter TrkA [Rhodovulum sulfidophilum]